MIGGIASGRVPVGNASGDLVTSWLNPTSLILGLIAVATAAYLAAVYLAADAVRIGRPELEDAFRTRALGHGRDRGRGGPRGPRSRSQRCAAGSGTG